ncbi:Cytochrome P450 52A5 OS=Candida maltosa GN=CYP52A5 PE=1 SV=1 [Rhizoctonia solani AG-1 IB]|uniref:Cytochrome P450 52A5 n=1 Tax=Thanatephorus cucumeris (strain AG1-IB / isolate 7/3/14) TaxID=1108050 RepID=A0A0B7FUE1_THACB|nr:Cytochrome P450 52A5 OS=Candida maltosa GN=CYP52A5 PE=1 SV=1 [Rhizoctonia solani AG-1 IB]
MMATFMELCHSFVYPECWALAIDATVHRRRDPAQTTMAKFYSRFIISSAFWTFVEPVIATKAILALLRSFYGPNDLLYFGKLIHNWSRVLYPLSIVLNELVSSHLASLRRKREMGRLGCYDLIPRVKGRWIGNIDVLIAITRNEANEYCGDIFAEWAEKYGPTFDMNILWAHQIVTVDPFNVKHIVATSFNQFEKGEKFHDMLEGFLGTGIFNSDGETWKLYRSMARPFFDRERVVNQSRFEQHTGRLKSLLTVLSSEGGSPFDIQDLFGRYTMDFTMAFLFGRDSRTMVPPHLITKESGELMSAFDALRKAASTRIRIGSNWPLFELFSDRMKGPRQTVDAYIMPIVYEAIKGKQNVSQEDDDGTRTFLEYLVTVSNDPKLIRDTLVSFLLAGRDTSASLLTFMVYVLALYPDTYDRLSKEVNDIVHEDRPSTFEEIKSMRYLRALINETLRVFPPVPFNIRRSTNHPSVLPSNLSGAQNGLFLYPRCSITYSLLHIHRRKDIWGDDAEEFRPDRWLAEGSQKVHVTNPFAFIPFNGGPRMCLGQNLAYLLVSHTIVELLRNFTWSLAPDLQPVNMPRGWRGEPGRKGEEQCWPKSSLTLYSDGGLFVKLNKKQIDST